MEKITYGAPGYMDYMAQLKAGKSQLTVHFTGGTMTQYGVTPAEYTTSNEFYQKVIEQSEHFKDGRIIVLKRYALPDKNSGQRRAESGQRTAESGDVLSDEVSEKAVVEVSCLQDAQAYLKEHHNVSSSKVRTKASASAIGSECGVEFVWV